MFLLLVVGHPSLMSNTFSLTFWSRVLLVVWTVSCINFTIHLLIQKLLGWVSSFLDVLVRKTNSSFPISAFRKRIAVALPLRAYPIILSKIKFLLFTVCSLNFLWSSFPGFWYSLFEIACFSRAFNRSVVDKSLSEFCKTPVRSPSNIPIVSLSRGLQNDFYSFFFQSLSPNLFLHYLFILLFVAKFLICLSVLVAFKPTNILRFSSVTKASYSVR